MEDDVPKDIDRDEVQRLWQRGARIVDVLPKADYEQFHLPGAINIPLEKINAASTAHLPKDLPLISYCHDTQ
jgi:rhodanese-related sulfurtransferase